MAKITVEISEPMQQWMRAEAGDNGVSVDQFVTNCLVERRKRSMPNTDELHLFQIVQHFNAKRGWAIAAQKLRKIWDGQGSSAELQTALCGLAAKGFIKEAEHGDGYVLTELGFEFQARIERG